MQTETLKIVLVGCGGMSRAWLSIAQAMEGVKIVGLVDLDRGKLHQRAQEFDLQEAYLGTDLEAALAAVQPEVVFDCTVPSAHASVTLQALQHGCHVLGEKPLADNMEEARKMVGAAEKAGKLYAVMQNRRYAPAIRSARKFLSSGALGRVHTVNADFYIGAHFGGFRDEMEHVLLLDMAIHSFDQARFLTGTDPRAVFCHEFNPPGSWYRHGASAMAIFEMTDDLVFNYRGSWCAEGRPTPWECVWRIIGEKATLHWDGAQGLRAELCASAEGFMREVSVAHIELVEMSEKQCGHSGVIHEFIDCVRQGGTPQTHGADNIKSLAMVFGAIESAETQRQVHLDPEKM